MIILKAEGTLAAVFHKTIKVMEQNVEWNETFAINNNTLILPGTLKSLFSVLIIKSAWKCHRRTH